MISKQSSMPAFAILLIVLLALSSMGIAAENMEGIWEAAHFQTSEYSLDAVQLFPQGCTISLGKNGLCDIAMGDYKERAKWEMKEDTLVFSGSYVFHTAVPEGGELAVPYGGITVYFTKQTVVAAEPPGTAQAGSPVPVEDISAAETKDEAEAESLRGEITLPAGWTMDLAVSTEDIQQVTGMTGYAIFPEASSDAPNGKPACGFVKDNNPQMKLTFSAFLQEGAARQEFFLGFATDTRQLPSALWDLGYELVFSNGSKAIVVLRGDACYRIDWWPQGYPDDDTIGERLAALLISRVYGTPE